MSGLILNIYRATNPLLKVPKTIQAKWAVLINLKIVMYNSPSRTSRNLFRERSLSSLPSRQFSVMDIIQKRQSVIMSDNKKHEEQKHIALSKDTEISKLRKNLQTAVSTALYQKIQSSKSKQELASQIHHKRYLQNKIKLLQKQNFSLKDLLLQKQNELQAVNQALQIQTSKSSHLQQQLALKIDQLSKKAGLQDEIEKYKIMLKDIEPLKGRIIALEEQNRAEKLKKKQAQKQLKEREKEKEELVKELAKTKPREDQLRERIAYYQRVNLDLQRKMEDYNRRENEYIKNITSLKSNLTRVTADRNHFKTVYEQTIDKLKQKIEEFNKLTEDFQEKMNIIAKLEIQLSEEKSITQSLKSQLEGKVLYYKKQGEQNLYLKQRNKILQQNQLQLRRIIEGYVKISQEVNLTIVARCEQIKKLKILIQQYKKQLEQTEQKFERFDKLLGEGSEKSYNQIKEGFYAVIRANNDYEIAIREMKVSFDEKFILIGQERDLLNRNKLIRSVEPPNDENQFLSIFHQKTEAMLLLQNSNDQLLKVKKDLEAKIEELQRLLQKQKKQMTLLKIKTAQMFKTKKDLDQARKKMERYQEMIQEQNQTAADLQSQINALRQKNTELNEKYFVIELQKRNLEVKLKQTNQVMKELDVQVLQVKKATNEKNAHLITDSIQKLQSAIKSLAFFFNCAFCGELPLSPVTLAMCGHTYCTKCKDAYAQSCYECDTGMPIEKAFQNRFLKDAGGKYKFLTMVLAELKANFLLSL